MRRLRALGLGSVGVASRQRGVTLIELMVVVVILGILVGVAFPAYRKHVMRTQRTDATSALLRIAAAQEKWYLQNNTYTADLSPAGLGIPISENGWYALVVAPDPVLGTLVDGFVATATPAAGGPQVADADCQTFTIDDQGLRGSAPSAREVCWK